MRQPRQHNLLVRLLNLACQEHFVQYRIDLVKVEDEIELAHIAEESIQHLDEKVYRLEVRQLVIVGVDACAEEEACVPPVHNLGHVAEFDKVGLVFLVAWGDEAVDL
jgi:hypothetical protein